jgi:acetyl-CoA carboxylase beta subunit
VQTAENLLAHGLVDAVVTPQELAAYLGRVLTAELHSLATGDDGARLDRRQRRYRRLGLARSD